MTRSAVTFVSNSVAIGALLVMAHPRRSAIRTGDCVLIGILFSHESGIHSDH